jgi:hypothetical protein
MLTCSWDCTSCPGRRMETENPAIVGMIKGWINCCLVIGRPKWSVCDVLVRGTSLKRYTDPTAGTELGVIALAGEDDLVVELDGATLFPNRPPIHKPTRKATMTLPLASIHFLNNENVNVPKPRWFRIAWSRFDRDDVDEEEKGGDELGRWNVLTIVDSATEERPLLFEKAFSV